MNKLFTKIASLSIGLALAIGVGVAVGSKGSDAKVARAADETLTFKDKYNANTNLNGVTVQGTNISAKFETNGGNTAPQYYTNGYAVRFYQKNKMTVKAGTNTMTSIVIGFGSSDGSLAISSDVGTYSNGTWTGSATSVAFTCATGSGNRRIASVTVTYSGGGATTYTVSYDKNDSGAGGTMTDTKSPYSSGATVTVLANNFTAPSGHIFDHWDTKSDDSGTDYNADDTFTISDNTTLYAQWATAFNVTYVSGEHSSSANHVVSVKSGSTHSLISFAESGFEADSGWAFKAWSINSVERAPDYEITVNAAVTVTAIYEEIIGYTLVTDASTLVAGTTFILLHESDSKAAGTYSNGIFPLVSASVSNNVATSENATVFTLGGSSGAWTIKFGNNYLGKTSSSGTGLENNNSVTTGYHWTINIADGKATMKTESSGSRAFAYNLNSGGTDRFGAYTPSSTYTLPRMFAIIPISGHNITFNENAGGDTVTNMPSTLTNKSGTVSLDGLNEPSRDNYVFQGWSLTSSGAVVESVTVDDSDVEVFAIWAVAPTPVATAKRCYSLVTSTDGLVATAKYIIVGRTASQPYSYYALSTTQNGNNRGQESIDLSGTVAPITSNGVQVITLGGSAGAWTFEVSGGYLYAASASKNYLRTQETNDANGQWAISITSEGVVTATAQGSNSHNLLQYNSSSGIFSAYGSAQQDVFLYRLDFGETLLGNITCSGSGSHTLPNNWSWNTDLQGVYNDLPAGEKTTLASASSAGLARYDYIVGKYNPNGLTDSTKTDYVHFITGRTVSPIGNSRIILDVLNVKRSSAAIIIIAISAVSLASIGGYFLFRKKKED